MSWRCGADKCSQPPHARPRGPSVALCFLRPLTSSSYEGPRLSTGPKSEAVNMMEKEIKILQRFNQVKRDDLCEKCFLKTAVMLDAV